MGSLLMTCDRPLKAPPSNQHRGWESTSGWTSQHREPHPSSCTLVRYERSLHLSDVRGEIIIQDYDKGV